ncbi:MAG: RIP metalloprotease RseP [Planktomarina sp.]
MFDLGAMVAGFGGLLWTLFFFVVALSIIVAIHEYGHYIVGRWCGIKADVFSIGMGPVLFGRTDKHGTFWQVAALPLGGYVKFKGDGDAASVTAAGEMSQMTAAEHRQTMQGAPVWARAATAAAGPVFNFIFSILMFATLFMWQGRLSDDAIVAQMVDLPGDYSIAVGDKIIGLDGRDVSTFTQLDEFSRGIGPKDPVEYRVERNGDVLTVTGPNPFPPIASYVSPQSAAIDAGLKAGDVILSVDGQKVTYFGDLQSIVARKEGTPLTLEIWRKGDVFKTTLTPRLTDIPGRDGGFEQRWLVGVSGEFFFTPPTESLSIVQAVLGAVDRTIYIITSSLSGLWNMITGAISTCNMSGPVTIAETSGQVATMGAITFLGFIAVLSTAIGMMNLFPIPMLDGGHLLFCAYEAITGKPPSDRAYQILMSFGIAFVGMVMIFALTNDLFCP